MIANIRSNQMNERDKRAVENMARCGLSLEGLVSSFPGFPADEIEKIYKEVHSESGGDDTSDFSMKMNCS